jgi:hypothetical protein
MKRLILAGILAVVAAGSMTAVAQAGPAEPSLPEGLDPVPAGHKLFLVGHATGVQIYRCDAGATGHAWTLVAPRADLYDNSGKVIVTHFSGPTWQAKDGSSVKAARADGVTVDPTAIPWLLLKANSATAGPDGDRLAGTAYIQRLATQGGIAPAAGQCNAATVGEIVEVPYTAEYYFWKKLGA